MKNCDIEFCRGCAYGNNCRYIKDNEPEFRALSKIDCVMIMLVLAGIIIGVLIVGIQ